MLHVIGLLACQDVPVHIAVFWLEELRLDRQCKIQVVFLLAYALLIGSLALSPGLLAKPIDQQLVERLDMRALHLTNQIHSSFLHILHRG
ncbi:hypothetical protein D3C77_626490 [compost metagenome]